METPEIKPSTRKAKEDQTSQRTGIHFELLTAVSLLCNKLNCASSSVAFRA
jgi:hypothetical protein